MDFLPEANPVEWAVIYGIEGILTLLGNALTIVVFRRRKQILKRATYLVINLAVADALVGLFTTLLSGVRLVMLNSTLVKGISQMDMAFVAASIMSLAWIALERAFALVKPLRHRTTKTRYYYYVVSSVWLSVGALCGAGLLGSYLTSFRIGAFVCFFVYAVSLLAIFISYIIIWWALSKRPVGEVVQRKQNRRTAVTLSALTLLSLATFLPGEVYVAYSDLSRHSYSLQALVAFVLVNGNSLVNPFVYAWRMPAFRHELLLLFSCKRRCQRRSKKRKAPQTVRVGCVALVKVEKRNSPS